MLYKSNQSTVRGVIQRKDSSKLVLIILIAFNLQFDMQLKDSAKITYVVLKVSINKLTINII